MGAAEFIRLVAPGAQEFQIQMGVWASTTIAQAALETGWGTVLPVDKNTGQQSNNLFGVKGTGPAGSVLSDTREVIDGRPVMVEDWFRAYHNIAESIADHGAVLLQERYRRVREAPTPEDACLALHPCGYATDPQYGEKLIRILRDHNLKRFDLGAGEIVVVKEVRALGARVAKIERILATGDDQVVSSWAVAAVELLQSAGIVGFDTDGDGTPEFCPKRPIIREELAEILRRLSLLNVLKEVQSDVRQA